MKRLRVYLPALIILFLCTSWGYFAHQRINRLAIYTLPKGMAGFYKSHIGFITGHAITADKRRYVDSSEIPRHFFNADRYGKNPFATIPRKWKDAVAKYSKDTLLKHGTLPWTIQQNYYWLVQAFKDHDTSAILRTSANLAHYVADAHVPLHLILNHDGQLTHQDGIHALWESRLPELFAAGYKPMYTKARYIENPLSEAFKICRASYNSADTVLRAERLLKKNFPADKKYAMLMRGKRKIKDYSPEYCRAYHKALNGMVERRMRAAVLEAGNYWFSAWVDAGQPDLNKLSHTVVSANTGRKTGAERALEIIAALPEVKDFMRNTPEDHQPDMMLAGEPDSTTKYYWVKVGISNLDLFRTSYNFYVDLKTMDIRYWDQLDENDSYITLKQWRHWRKTPGWTQRHTYKNGKLVVIE